jgi:transcription elongation factor GreA
MEKMPITRDGFNKLKKELDHLKTVMVPENIRDIEVARAHGDLSENAEYTAAKERQAFLHGKRQELENNLMMSKIIDISNITKEKVVFGSSVVIEDTNTSETITYQLLGPFESDINEKKISVTSPIGKALIGKAVGEEVNVKTPGGFRQFEIIDIF